MKQRQMIILGVGFVFLAGSFLAQKKLAASKQAPQKAEIEKKIRTVKSLKVENTATGSEIDITGKLISANKIDVYSEVTGKLLKSDKAFKEGSTFSKGETLLLLDGDEQRMNLLSQRSAFQSLLTQIVPDIRIDYPEDFSKWEHYLNQFDVNQHLAELPAIQNSKEKNFLAAKNIYSQYFNIKSLENKIDKFEIKAPFSGAVSLSMVNPGTIIRSGQKIGEFIDTQNYEFEATVHINDSEFINIGDEVVLTGNNGKNSWTGRVKRVSQHVDTQSQSIKIYIGVSGNQLKEGMYLNGTVSGKDINNSFRIPRKLLVGKNELYSIQNNQLHLETVQIEKLSANHAIVSGLPEGSLILGESGIGFYEGLEVNPKQ